MYGWEAMVAHFSYASSEYQRESIERWDKMGEEERNEGVKFTNMADRPIYCFGKGLAGTVTSKRHDHSPAILAPKISKEQTARELAKGNAYICYLNGRDDIDGNTLKNKARYINHSCDPNCEIQTTSPLSGSWPYGILPKGKS